jgi:Family of unknown function (DUF6680)
LSEELVFESFICNIQIFLAAIHAGTWSSMIDPTTSLAIATVIAVLVGPVLAVLVTRWVDKRREEHGRRWDVFRALMRSRRNPIAPEFVGALNLIEVEFAGRTQVVEAWKALLENFSAPLPTAQNDQNLFFTRRGLLVARLLDAIAKAVGIRIEQLDIYSGGYTPVGWETAEMEQQSIKRFFIEILEGKRGFPVELAAKQGEKAPPN